MEIIVIPGAIKIMCDRYTNMLVAIHGDWVKPINMVDTEPSHPCHLAWMLQEMREWPDASHKAHRWLGYVQGVLSARGYIDVNVERDFSREILS